MSAVWEWVRNLTMIVILFSFVEILLPGSGMKRCMKFIFSLAMLAMVLSPISDLMQKDVSVLGNVPVSEELRELAARGDDGTADDNTISRVQTKQIETVYVEKLKTQLTEDLKEKFSGITVTSVEIYINNEVRSSGFGKPEKASVTISDPDFEKAVRDFTADRLQIEKRSVTIALAEE